MVEIVSKRLVMPLIEDGEPDARLRPLRERWGLAQCSAADALGTLLHANDTWLSASAYRAVTLLRDGTAPAGVAALAEALPERTPDMNLLEKVEFLTRAELFAGISTEQLGQTAAATAEADFDGGDVVFSELEYADFVYVVVQGEVRLSGETIPEHVAGEGEVFGMLALFADEARLLTAVATQPTQTLRLDRDVFLDLLADHAEISRGMLSNLTRKIQTLSAELRERRELPPA